MFCNKCGARLGQGETYCNRCGAPVRSSQVEQTQLIYDTQTPAPAPPYQDSCQQQAVQIGRAHV